MHWNFKHGKNPDRNLEVSITFSAVLAGRGEGRSLYVSLNE